MGYEISLKLAWDELDRLALQDCTVYFLGENYQLRAGERAVLQPSGVPAAEMQAVLILHYLIGLLKHGYHPTGMWISFKETDRRQALLACLPGELHQAACAELSAGSGGPDPGHAGAPGRPEGGRRGCGGGAGHVSWGLSSECSSGKGMRSCRQRRACSLIGD